MSHQGLKLLLGVSSSIAAYRALDIASTVVKGGGAVRVVMTANATNLVGPAAFDAITGQRTITSLWEGGHSGEMDHLAVTKWANAFAVAPASAATIARLRYGLADDALSTFAIAWPRAMVIAPAMNPAMYANPVVQENVAALQSRGHRIVEPAVGPTACGDMGKGRLAAVPDIVETIMAQWRAGETVPFLHGHQVLITSGPTREFADPVRCITNPSTGKMGVALARQAVLAGARVTLVTGPCEQPMPDGLHEVVRVVTADQMRDAVLAHLPRASICVYAAAVSDWRPAKQAEKKAKKEGAAERMTMELERTPDVALAASKVRRADQVFVGFAAESHDLVAHAQEKLRKKGFDFVVANPVLEKGAGFGADTNRAILVSPAGERELPLMTKDALALEILREAAKLAKPPQMRTDDYPLGLGDA